MTDRAPIWTPPADLVASAEMTRLLRQVGAADYHELWRWSVDDLPRFWATMWRWFDIRADGDPSTVLADRSMPGARWFPDVALSFPEHVFRDRDDAGVAVVAAAEGRAPVEWTWGRLREQTARVRAGLRAMGVGRGDRVVGYLPNTAETIAAFLAVSSLGAVWSCCSPDFGARTVIDRLSQVEPAVLLAVDHYDYGGQRFDRSEVVDQLRAALPTLRRTVLLGEDWDEAFPATAEPLEFERVPFDHPLWIVYSSGTTGLPKAIVHGHGGPLLEHQKTWRLHHDARPGDRVMWTTTTGWIMWNLVVGALTTPVSAVIYDGSVGHPDLGVLWDLIDDTGITMFGTGAAYLHGCMKRGLRPREGRKLARLRAIGSTGSPLAPDAYRWVSDAVGEHIWLCSASGGTDVACGFVGGSPLLPVRAGELQAKLLGVDAQAWDDQGRPVVDEVGELVVTQPMPSMPVKFWNDPGGERYRDSYFSMFPGVWRHGDWIRFTPDGASVIFGRSDATINRAGIRMGTAEIYAAVLAVPEVADALVVDVPSPDGTGDGEMILFVVPADGAELTEAVADELRARIRRDCSPRHVPNRLVTVPAVPRTLSGKALEIPIKRILMGHDPGKTVDPSTLANPESLDWYLDFARTRLRAV
ncbi:acetoacetate--CoA ligase [Pseudonocardia eucalypti]|uniref:Acetoacetate--CoA ligase n=1 Tax=Pseudonocardia eucalypti TaxID=648755 RepID=A0ABP9QWK4_9PSEU|nr:acetoacetyl-CoA synthetase [Pseudonocardia eucalypti]